MVINGAGSAQDIDVQVADWVGDAYASLFKTLMVALIAIAVATIGVCLFAAIHSRKSAYIFKDTTPKKLHYSLLILIPFLAVRNIPAFSDALAVSLYVLACILALVGFWGLARYRVYGVAGAIAYFWASALSAELRGFLAAVHDKNEISAYSAPGKIAVYAAGDYIVSRIIVVGFLLLIISVILTAYYVRRRYLFLGIRESKFFHQPLCPHCGKPMIENAPFCTGCGSSLSGQRWLEPDVKVLDTEKHCKHCGALLNKNKDCPICAAKENFSAAIQKGLKGGLKEGFTDSAKSILAMLLLLVIVFLPAIFGDAKRALTIGSAAANNAYVEKLNEFWKDPTVAGNKEWVDGFMAAGNALYAVNERCFFIHPHALLRKDLLFYALYAEASYRQMVVLEEIAAAVKTADSSHLDELMRRFNVTIDEQSQATTTSFHWFQSETDIFTQISNIFWDGIRFYVSYVDLYLAAVAILVLGALAFFLSLETVNKVKSSKFELFVEKFNKNTHRVISSKLPFYQPSAEELGIFQRMKSIIRGGLWFYMSCFVRGLISCLFLILGAVFLLVSVVRPRNFLGLAKWIQPAFLHRTALPRKADQVLYAAYRKEKRKTNVIAGMIAASLFSVIFFAADTFPSLNPDQSGYLETVDSVLIGRSMDLSAWLLEVKSGPDTAFTDADKQNVIALIEVQMEALTVMQDYPDVPDKYQAFHAGINRLCVDERTYLVSLRQYISAGQIPPQSLISAYAALRAENYHWLLLEYAEIMRQLSYDSVQDIFH